MKKLWIIAGMVAALFAAGCTNGSTDPNQPEPWMNETAERKERLNLGMEAMQAIISAAEADDVITDMVWTSGSGSGEVAVTLSSGGTVTIPYGDMVNLFQFGAEQDAGSYYWTLTTDDFRKWLMDGSDNVSVTGTLPVIAYDSEWYWTVNTGSGPYRIADIYGNPVPAQNTTGDSFVLSVSQDDDSVNFMLANNVEISVRKLGTMIFSVEFSGAQDFHYGATREFGVAQSWVENVDISKPAGWAVAMETGKASITAPAENAAGAEMSGQVKFTATGYGSAVIVTMDVTAIPDYGLRVLSFEDADYRGDEGAGYWTSLIDSPQYNGPLLYSGNPYGWYDENNTFLASELADAWGDGKFWGGGHAISNYLDTDLAHGNHTCQLSVYYRHPTTSRGGHNGSDNFCVHNGYREPGDTYTQLPYIYFMDYEARVVDHMYVANTTYFYNSALNGDGFCPAAGPADYVYIEAVGYDGNYDEITSVRPKFYLLENGVFINEWAKWDLSELGPVFMIEFNVYGTLKNGPGFAAPAYFAYDDVTVRFPL